MSVFEVKNLRAISPAILRCITALGLGSTESVAQIHCKARIYCWTKLEKARE